MFASGSVAKGSSSSSKLPKYSNSRGPLDRSRRPWFISLLIAVKVCSSLAVFMLADFLKHSTHSKIGNGHGHRAGVAAVTEQSLSSIGSFSHHKGLLARWGPAFQTLAFIQIVSGLIYIFVQKPISSMKKSPLTPVQWFKIFRHSVLMILYMLTWVCGLTLTGPFKTVFLSSHYDYTLAGIISGFFVAKFGPRLRGGVLFVAGLMVLLLFDDVSVFKGDHHRPSRNTEHEQQTYLSRNSAGIMTLILFLMFKLSFDALTKSLAVDLGGGIKRLHSLSTFMSGMILCSLVILDLLTGGSMVSVWSNFLSLLFVVLFGFVLNYYVDSICMKRMDTWQVSRIGTSASHFSALLYSLIWITLDEVPSVATLIGFALIYFATWSLTTSERASGGGTLIGFSTDGLPLFNFSSHFSGEGRIPLWKNLLRLGFSFYKQIQEDVMSRRIFYYFLLTVAFTTVEFSYGAITNSLGLISDGFHMLFDAMAIFVGLFASVMSRWKPSPSFPFGYGRIEVLSGFLNAFCLLVVAGAIFVEAWARLFSPPPVDAHQTLTISVIGLIINLIGIYVFRNGNSDNAHLHDNANIRGVFLHVLADTMSSIGVIFSSLLIKYFGLLVADPICSLVIAALIATTAWPLLKDCSRILLLSVPSGLERNLQQAVLQLLAAEGVKGYKALRFWSHAPQILTGSIHIQAINDANEQQIIRHVNNLFSSIGFTHFSTQVEKDEFVARRNYVDEDDIMNCKSVNGMEIVGIGPDDLRNSASESKTFESLIVEINPT